MVTKPIRGKATLDKRFTDMFHFYNDTIVSAPLGKSDHDVVISYPYNIGKLRSFTMWAKSHNKKVILAYHLQQMKWNEFYHIEQCEDKVMIC